MVFTLFSRVISQVSIKQKIVVTTTIKAEYITLILVVKEALQLKQLFKEILIPIGLINLKIDAQRALNLAINTRFSQKTKHINIRYYFIRDYINTINIKLKYIPTIEIIANILTKPLARPTYKLLRLSLVLLASLTSNLDYKEEVY